MESLPLDLRRKIALELSPKELIELCLSSKDVFYKGICGDDEFWRLKIEYDYPEVVRYFRKSNLILRNPKNTYIRVFSKISKIIEDQTKNDKNLYNFFFIIYNELRRNMPYQNQKEFDDKILFYIKKYKYLYNYKNYIYFKRILFDISLNSPLYTNYGAIPFN